ncbi:MAG TPA: hypothetical protein VF190_16360 [Rhodothermales bacterium]
MRKTLPFLAVGLALGILLSACDTREFDDPLAEIEVSVVTEGDAIDEDGYVVLLDGEEVAQVAANGLAIIDGLEPGSYVVRLEGLAPNCLVAEQEVEVTVVSRETAEAAFEIVCTEVDANLMFESDRSGSLDLHAIDFTTGIVRPVTDAPGPDYGGAVSPDGTWIVFTSRREGNLELYRMRPDGSALSNITMNPADDTDPAFSPDGTHVAFASDREGDDEIWVMSIDGSDLRRVTDRLGADDAQPVWLDDNRILFTSTTERSTIWVMDVNTGVGTLLVVDAAYPAVSRDGSRIAYTAMVEGNAEIFAANPDGSAAVQVTDHPAEDLAPAFSPDGTRIAFVSNRTGNSEIFLVGVDGGEPLNLTNHTAFDFKPVFVPQDTP